ncbi:MAG: Qat anti-phage system QueC-like protein QatC [Sulfuricurvum sp.]|nr:Qat anti-phage system QueC-like protein QatC [Sulfuricurvum sp.]MDP3023145.1 Qat anti-phage system QueC-like protein QatC [Sulfuricurvum sp.]MDP3119812.1 Qat anti-phage system QueC-like protein QatC [Sulfuricurvum sp.]
MKVICLPANQLPTRLDSDAKYFSLYSNSGRPNVSFISNGWHRQLERANIAPSNLVWDFVTIALSVAAADLSCERKNSEDGWTRQIELEVYLCNPEPWKTQFDLLEKAFRFLTGDVWKFDFKDNGIKAPSSILPLETDADCVSLLSGGMDSLIGAIDLISDGIKPCFVSQEAKGDVEKQKAFTTQLAPAQQHFKWKNPISLSGRNESSTRGRSVVFLGYALLAATTLSKWETSTVDIYVPENGLISLNIALNSGRLGSLSTKTTHPIFLGLIQNIWDNLGINAKLITPYQFKTKGEMLLECKNQDLVKSLICNTTSCGKYLTHGRTHCGRCVPCMVRRAAFLKAGVEDSTIYKYRDLSNNGFSKTQGPNDVNAVAYAYVKYKNKGIERIIGGALSFSSTDDRYKYAGVVERGLQELGELFKGQEVYD